MEINLFPPPSFYFIFSLYYLALVRSRLLYCITLIFYEKNSRLKRKRLESSYISRTGKFFSRQFRITVQSLFYIDNFRFHLTSNTAPYPRRRDERYRNPLFPLGSPNFLSFFRLPIPRAGDRIMEWSIFRCEEKELPVSKEKETAPLANKEGLFSRDFTEATPRKHSPLSGIPSYLGRKLSQPPCAEPGNVGYEPCSKFSPGARVS